MAEPGTPPVIGIIGGSGLYDIDGLTDRRREAVDTPFGSPSDEILLGSLGGHRLAFLPRHGRGHATPPGEINFRANIDALKRVGATEILSLSAVGSLDEALAPGTFVLVDQFIDRTFQRITTFFGTGLVAHVSMADPVCPRLGDALEEAASGLDIETVRGGTYVVIDGPQFSSRAESELYRKWGANVIGMTNMPEAKLAREAEMCYATVAMVTDYDCWHPGHDDVTVEAVIAVLQENAAHARALVEAVVPLLGGRRSACAAGCHTTLDTALITPADARDPELAARLGAIAGRALGR